MLQQKTTSTIHNIFQGFSPLNYTQVPDEFFDNIAPFLSEAQLKVMLYIIRRTFGFKKENDNISLSQMLNGIVTKKGERLDYGVGVKKKALLNALNWLETNGYIIRARNRSRKRGDEATTFSLHIKNVTPPGVFGIPGGRYPKDTTQETVLQETDINSNREIMKKEEKRGGGFKSIATVLQQATAIAVKSTTNSLEQTITPKEAQRSRRENATPQKPSQTPYKAYGNEKLIAIAKELGREFGDMQHERENIGQVHNIYKVIKKRGLTDSTLIDMMKRAAGLTREIEGRFTTSKMAYFFIVLRREYNIPPP